MASISLTPLGRATSRTALPRPSSSLTPPSPSPTPSSILRTPSPAGAFLSRSPSSSGRRTPPPSLLKTSPVGKDNVVVCVRVRPTFDHEREQRLKEAWLFDEINSKVSMEDDVAEKARRSGGVSGVTEFQYDIVQTGSDNKELYELSAQNVVWAAMEGINGTVFAYGQTASGKTYSMMGIDDQPGIIPQAIDDVFSYIREQSDDREYLLRVSYMEI
ncbi:hypothetical protein HK100_008743 [Physocladia obscura]|uniref:Kinesin motor domain-containing protein n=1 Tax=Physocladia obscura TaxID=109957 RepID=A0AAD5T5L2_9FUNG|nr:hypothetical protein HK100_008743 [Physocladia obscura]